MKQKLTFYTNIPTPYQTDFFEALAAHVDLTVVYYAPTERGRQWVAEGRPAGYQAVYLRDSRMARFVQRWLVDWHFSWSIFGTLRRDQACYVIVSGGYWVPNTLAVLLMTRWRGAKQAFFGERLRPSSGMKTTVKRLLLQLVDYTCVRVFAVGQEAADTYAAFGVSLPRTVVAYALQPDTFRERPASVERSGPDRPLVLFSAGALIPRKGMDTLIRAFRQLDRSYYAHLRLRIAGEGPEGPTLHRLAAGDPRIEFLGFCTADTLPRHFACADIFVLASRYDGWGVVINEAIAAGLPIISSNTVGAARSWIQESVNGLLCSPDDTDAFASSMRRLVDDADLRRRQACYNRSFRSLTSASYYAARVYQTILNDLAA
ncbi:glycosyltransferase family 4 protein [Spirosoma utsteinense]|uniref:Glycosyltransferase involved in cell wall biosynthesis n=1 Tax=Spirosoma utsteinense TaxID=2585773 RepID=A0ABR6W6S8_9BACT|nr:glycosyltransferase family 4 protein [Spirosoma utsteinense]MBC3792270.1 glycosyltransferase involved in cell wall biosynthesis [Spirosoma utsteinense]